MFFFKQLGIAIAIMIVLSVIIAYLNKKESYTDYNPYRQLDYIGHPNAWKSRSPITLSGF